MPQKPKPKPAPKPQPKPRPKPPKPRPSLTPYVLIALAVLGVAGCELLPTRTRVRYVPSAPDTVVVRDTVVVDDEDDKPRWRP